MLGAALKLQLTPQFKFAVIYDQPFAVDIDYRYRPKIYGESYEVESADIDFESHNLSSLLGYQFNPQWKVVWWLKLSKFCRLFKSEGYDLFGV